MSFGAEGRLRLKNQSWFALPGQSPKTVSGSYAKSNGKRRAFPLERELLKLTLPGMTLITCLRKSADQQLGLAWLLFDPPSSHAHIRHINKS